MRHSILLFAFIAISICRGYSQITKISVSAPIDAIQEKVDFDGQRNFLGDDVYQYIGEELYLNEKSESLRKYGYSDFTTDYTKFHLDDLSIIYKRGTGDAKYSSDYKKMAGRYFNVISVHKHPKAASNNDLYGKKYFIKLEERDSKDIVYYEYNAKHEFLFPFIVVKFFEKQKATRIGQKYIFTNKAFENTNDIQTGLPLTFETEQVWTCKDITIDELHYYLSMVVVNNQGECGIVPYYRISESANYGRCFSLESADQHANRFGKSNWITILEGKIKVGFTEEMVILSWGKPQEVNRASYGDQWVYHGQYLYFENKILTSFN